MKTIVISLVIVILAISFGCKNTEKEQEKGDHPLESFLIQKSELKLRFHHPAAERLISFKNFDGDFQSWETEVLGKLTDLIGYTSPGNRAVIQLRETEFEGITYRALVMEVSDNLSIPAYLLVPEGSVKGVIMAIHGHGAVEPMLGIRDDYHHMFAYELAKEGYIILAPELRGFSTLGDLAWQEEIDRLDYWNTHGQFTLVTDGFLHGETLIGQTTEDLIAWENWFFDNYNYTSIDVAGISYGADLAILYPVYSNRVGKIFSSGSLGSFNLIFSRCYNAPAHCIPDILTWMDRSDIAGLNSPRPIMLHYGELDTPSVRNHSAAYNESVNESVMELREIYKVNHAEDNIVLEVTENKHHEMDIDLLINFLDSDDSTTSAGQTVQ